MNASPQERRNIMKMISPTPDDAMIVFDGVSKSYNGAVALHETALAVRRGEFLSLLGPSGSGKSTILNIIAGAIAPSSGRIFLNGADVSTVPPRERQLGMVFQNYALLPHLNVYDNIAFPLRIRGASNAEIKQKVGDALERVGLVGYEKRKPREMSGGQQQRVGIARCIVYSPSVILMDEPLGALDKKLRDQLQGEIKKLHRDLGTTLVYVTHDQEEALNLSDRVCLMNGGRIAQLGTPDELYFEPVDEFVADFVGESNLFAGVLRDDHQVDLDGGWLLRVRSAQGFLPGERVKVMVRPEKVEVAAPGDASDAHPNRCVGTVNQISFVGGMTRFEVRLADGCTVLVKGISDRAADRIEVGASLALRWAAHNTVVIKANQG
ncbi:ABC transporter ATP-binding protein [Verminephrobacter eiseniae]|nr:ABC transporter ATP-binding protein [Verminephrobacter eiseniae]MCW5291887.1 ABC transporter ATP-binding protein [Verminephrobacter eiseniae]MCW8187586.1 ABC transporter ATP-binding protein [Verminephrobacter eiseniae]MCW8225897.1 ABC transporter ATP-binding protein [Verminephrobacter eiseniae]MCW8236810.1 ABC transporter ATP-binding protein [Verminephrobacter eiseniae]